MKYEYEIRTGEEIMKKAKANKLGEALLQINLAKRLNRQLVRASRLGVIKLFKVVSKYDD